jgi:hypothetical protein
LENACRIGIGEVKEDGKMMSNESFQSLTRENALERKNLGKLAAGLSDEELSCPMEAGWTVSAVLAHLSFWDSRAITLIHKWEKEGIGDSPVDSDVINEATRELCLAIPARMAAKMAVEKAFLIDQLIEQLSPDLMEGIMKIGTTVHLKRYEHRRMHRNEIEKILGKT